MIDWNIPATAIRETMIPVIVAITDGSSRNEHMSIGLNLFFSFSIKLISVKFILPSNTSVYRDFVDWNTIVGI